MPDASLSIRGSVVVIRVCLVQIQAKQVNESQYEPLLVKGVLSLPLLYEKTLRLSGKNQKRCEEIAKEISAAANYSMDQSCLRFVFCLPTTIHPSRLSISEKSLANGK